MTGDTNECRATPPPPQDELLLVGTRRPAWTHRTRIAAAAVALAVVVGAVGWQQAHRATDPGAASTPAPQSSGSERTLPAYAERGTVLAGGGLLVHGVPADVRAALRVAFPQASDVDVQTVFPRGYGDAHAAPVAGFTARLLNARAGEFRVAMLAARRVSGAPVGTPAALNLQAAAPGPGRVYSAIQAHVGRYLVNLYVIGPSSMSLIALDHDPRLLSRLVGRS